MDIGLWEDRRFASHMRGTNMIGRPELLKGFRPKQPDSAADKLRKESQTNDGKSPGATKEPQQKDGVWCAACRRHHRPMSPCINATTRK